MKKAAFCQNGLRRDLGGGGEGGWVLKRKVLHRGLCVCVCVCVCVRRGGGVGVFASLVGDIFLNFCQNLTY